MTPTTLAILSLALLSAALLLLAFWQGRRLGPLVAERLPDVNRVVEVGGRDYGVLRLSFLVDGVADHLWSTLFNTLLFGTSTLALGLLVTRALLSRWLSNLGTLQTFD